MKNSIIIGLLLCCINSFAQNYSPKNPGSKWTYAMSNGSFVDSIAREKFKYNDREYFLSIRKYSWGSMDTSYFRIGKNGTVYYLDPKSGEESIDVPGSPELSLKWINSDNTWRYEIVELSATLKTPEKSFTDCLVIKAEQVSNSDITKLTTYFNYYSKSIGYVGSKVDGQLMAYLNSWELK